jgi:Leu/Phe-tRNA-protein transferase
MPKYRRTLANLTGTVRRFVVSPEFAEDLTSIPSNIYQNNFISYSTEFQYLLWMSTKQGVVLEIDTIQQNRKTNRVYRHTEVGVRVL